MVTVVHGNTHLSLGERRRALHDAYVLYSIQYGVYEYARPGTEEPVHWFDIGMTIALILSGVWGCLRGLVRAMLSLIGLGAASVLAVRGYPDLAQRLAPLIATLWVRQAIGFALIFCGHTWRQTLLSPPSSSVTLSSWQHSSKSMTLLYSNGSGRYANPLGNL